MGTRTKKRLNLTISLLLIVSLRPKRSKKISVIEAVEDLIHLLGLMPPK